MWENLGKSGENRENSLVDSHTGFRAKHKAQMLPSELKHLQTLQVQSNKRLNSLILSLKFPAIFYLFLFFYVFCDKFKMFSCPFKMAWDLSWDLWRFVVAFFRCLINTLHLHIDFSKEFYRSSEFLVRLFFFSDFLCL